MNETTQESLLYQEIDNFENSKSVPKPQSPLLPRSSWQNRQAFLKVLMRAKRSLDIAEISAFLD